MERNFNQLFTWENKERINYLKNFKEHVTYYFNNIESNNVGDWWENKEAKKEREIINKYIDKAHAYINESNLSTEIDYYPPPITGQSPRVVDLVFNTFNLLNHHISYDTLLDIINRSIGIYENNTKNAIIRTFNPFFWIALLIDYIISIPFEILVKYNLIDKNKAEKSYIVRIIKVILSMIFHLIIFAEACLQLLNITGYLPKLIK